MLLYKDLLTHQHSNVGKISHIVAFSPDGARGDVVRSPLLEKSLTNLMLTCYVHGKIIDDRDKVQDYPEALLFEYKKEHEDRVRRLTESTPSTATHVVIVQAPIDGQRFSIQQEDAFRAIVPHYPAQEEAEIIDLSDIAVPNVTAPWFDVASASLTKRFSEILLHYPGRQRVASLSLFALAPIPLLVHIGHLLGDIHHVDVYQRHRDKQNWIWNEEQPEDFFEVLSPEVAGTGTPVALVLSVSAPVDHSQVEETLGGVAAIYEISAKEPSLDFLQSRERLIIFGYEVRKLLAELRQACGYLDVVHVFAAVPSPIAVEFGRSVKAYDCSFAVYEYQKGSRSYMLALTINSAKGG